MLRMRKINTKKRLVKVGLLIHKIFINCTPKVGKMGYSVVVGNGFNKICKCIQQVGKTSYTVAMNNGFNKIAMCLDACE